MKYNKKTGRQERIIILTAIAFAIIISAILLLVWDRNPKSNEGLACASIIKYSEMPASIITASILKSDAFYQQDVCKESGSYSWNYNGSKYNYSITSTIPGSGNFHGNFWRLMIKPYTIEGINAGIYPFLSCSDFYADKHYSWHISVKNDSIDGILDIVVDNVKPPVSSKDLEESDLEKISRDFTSCDALYSYQ